MAVVHGAELAEIIVDGGESAKSLNRPGMARLLAMVDAGEVKTVIIAKLDRLTRSVKDLARCWSGSSAGAWPWCPWRNPWIRAPRRAGWCSTS